jgi:UTP--glucose-1-phosphate uridylyltransferase
MVSLYKQFRCCIIAVQEVPRTEAHKYGVIAGEVLKDGLLRVFDMVEKPEIGTEPSNLAIIGRYILTPDIFGLIENTALGKVGEIQITDALLEQAKKGCVIAYKFKGKRFDCGPVEGYIDANSYCFHNLYPRMKM